MAGEVAAPSGFGAGLGTLIGGMMADESLGDGFSRVKDATAGFDAKTQPYNDFGSSFLPGTGAAIGGINEVAGTVKGWDDFMRDYETTPGAKYQVGQAQTMQDSTALSRGQLLSGANMRGLTDITNGIVAKDANQSYNAYLTGNNQQFGQLERALGNMFQAIGVGQTATGQQAGVTNAGIAANTALTAEQAKNDRGKGSGIGSMFGGLGSLATLF